MNQERSYLVKGLFGGLFVGIGAVITMIGGIFSQIRVTPAMAGYVYELLTVGVMALIIGAGILVWFWNKARQPAA
jgi:hypothetical protein